MHEMSERLRDRAAKDPFFEILLLQAADELDRMHMENGQLAMLVDELIHERKAAT